MYTKDSDSLPVSSTRLEYEPCMNPTQTSMSPQQTFYALENHGNGCEKDITNDLVNDPRYEKTGLELTEYELQDDNHVFSVLAGLPDFNP